MEGRTAAARAWKAHVLVGDIRKTALSVLVWRFGGFVSEERCTLILLDRGGRICGLRQLLVLDAAVVKALHDQNGVGETKVDCQSCDGGHETCPKSSGQVGHISNSPDEEEGERNAVSVALLVVLNQLRDKQENPCRLLNISVSC